MLDVRGRTTRRRLVALALGCAALGAPAAVLAQDAQVEAGFALAANLQARVATVAVTGGGGVALTVPELSPGLIIGFKTGRVVIGLGLEFDNFTTTQSQTVGGVTASVTNSNSDFLIGPDFQIAIVRSADQRVELIGDLALHLGHQFITQSMTPAPPPPPNPPPTNSNLLISYRLGPGVRFWAHRHFALQAATGFAGLAYKDLPAGNNAANDSSSHSIYTSIGALGVF
jgi:hypothetical protein